MSEATHISITEITVTTGETSKIKFDFNGKVVYISIPSELKAYFDSQFSRPNPSAIQKRKYSTLMNLMRYSYAQGIADGLKNK